MVGKSGHGCGCGHGRAHGQVLTTLEWALEPIQAPGRGIKTMRWVQLMPTHLQVSLRAQSIQKGKHHNLSKDTVVQLGKGPAPAITGLCRLRREHRNEPEALATQ